MKKKFQENFEIFYQNLFGKLTFFIIFYYILIGFLPHLRKYIPLEAYGDTVRACSGGRRVGGSGGVGEIFPRTPEKFSKMFI